MKYDKNKRPVSVFQWFWDVFKAAFSKDGMLIQIRIFVIALLFVVLAIFIVSLF